MHQVQAQGDVYAKSRPALGALSKAVRRRYLLFILLVAPAFLLRLTTAAYPILQTIYLSFTNLNLLKNTNAFVGLQNYPALANDYGVQGALSFTLMLVAGSTLLDLVVGMLVALLLNISFRGTGFARTINLIPWAIPTIVAGYAFRWLLDDQFGLIPYWVNLISGARMVTFISPVSARVAVILVHVWKDAPFMAFVFLAGLQGVPLDLYDAAKVDGANAWQRFWRITLPLVMPLAITMGLFRLVWSLGSFDLVYGLTQGGPGVATSVLALQVFTVRQSGPSPWQLSLRLPEWCQSFDLALNNLRVQHPVLKKGYILLERTWRPGDVIDLNLAMPPFLVASNPRVDATRDCLAIQRGPVVYCLEGCDQKAPDRLLDMQIDADQPLHARWQDDLLGGIMTVEAAGYLADPEFWQGVLYQPSGKAPSAIRRPVRLMAIPYYAWGNRGIGSMRVWIPKA